MLTSRSIELAACISVVSITVLGVLSASDRFTVSTLSSAADMSIKVLAMIFGATWTINRYLVSRVDEPQIRVTANVERVPGRLFSPPVNHDLLIYQLEIENTSKTQIPYFEQVVQIEEVTLDHVGIHHDELHRWPEHGTHLTGPIEPGSWSAINSAVAVSPTVVAVRFYLSLTLASGHKWTWHRTFAPQARETRGATALL